MSCALRCGCCRRRRSPILIFFYQAALFGDKLDAMAQQVGGIVEEFLMRLFVMSFLCWFLWKFFARKENNIPEWALFAGNILAAILFAAAHLPAMVTLFGSLDVLILLRCFLLNGAPGFCFGLLSRYNKKSQNGIDNAVRRDYNLTVVSGG